MSSRVLLLFGLMLTSMPAAATGQELAFDGRKPRFVAAWTLPGKVVDASNAAVLRRRVSLDIYRLPLADALREIAQEANLELSYNPALLPEDKTASLRAEDITVVSALTEVLLDTGVDVAVGRGGELTLLALPARRATALAQDSGTVVGRVSNKEAGAPIAGATVVVEGTRLITTTNNEGLYRFARVAEGTYTVRARYIGYTSMVASVTVRPGEEATVDFSLERSVHQLAEVVVTGTYVPTEVRALPTPVTVIKAEDIALQRPKTVQELFRQTVPGAVGWDDASVPYYTAFSVRGASTLAGQVGQMKVFLDGIETTSPSLAAVDPNSLERVEVIRGPQAAAIYGSDAIGGVIQFFTKRGNPSLARSRIAAEVAPAVIQTPYDGFGSVFRQNYAASVRGGGSNVSYSLGAGYSHTADWLPNGEESAQSNPSVFGGIQYTRGIITVDASGRYYTQNNPIVVNPALSRTGFFFFAQPFFQPQKFQNQTVGARLTLSPRPWWQHRVTVGLDRVTQDVAQSRPRRTSADDTLLTIFNQNQTKTLIGYNTSIEGSLGSNVLGSLTVGVDHYTFPLSLWSTSGALNTTGAIQTADGFPISANRTVTNNTGYFAQAQLGFREMLFITGGVRAEENTNFGDSLGTPVSPRAGVSYVRQLGTATLKLRGSWGEAIRAPSPRDKLASVSAASVVLANPTLGPERQKGWDVGIDALLGRRASLSITYYDQTADDLIQFVQFPSSTVPTFQAQNVGRVKNTGVEVEATMLVGPVQFKGQYGYARARIEQLAPDYTGDLRVGDQTLITPKHKAGASVTVVPFVRTTVSGGLTYVGSWNEYDYFALYSCFGGSAPCQPSGRDYIIEYPDFVKVNVSVSQQITRSVSGFVSVDNLTNNDAFEASNLAPVLGRITAIGFRFTY